MTQAKMQAEKNEKCDDLDALFNEYKKREERVLKLNKEIETRMTKAGLV